MSRALLQIGADRVTHVDVARVARRTLPVAVSDAPAWIARMARGRDALEARIRAGDTLYGVTTGFGASVVNEVPAAQSSNLARNLFRFHGCGVGDALSREETRAVLVTRLAQLAAGWSGIRVETLRAMAALLEHDLLPRIPELGSVGASGDLTPMSYVAAVLAGEHEVIADDRAVPAAQALAAAGLAPHVLAPKETLSIMNGTSMMTALVALSLERAEAFARGHAVATAWTSFALRGQAAHFDERLLTAKPHPGSTAYAGWVRGALACGARPPLHDGKLQDPYSVRCAPHIVGVLVDVLTQGAAAVEIELNGAGDNPLIDEDTGAVLHGGNFYGSYVTHVADTVKLHLAHAAEVLERQLLVLCHSTPTSGVPENLVTVAGPGQAAHHGFKAIEILASAIVAEMLKLASPASVFSRSTEAHNQDKVPMGPIAARDLRRMMELADHVLAISLLASAQATDASGRVGALPAPLARLHAAIRALAPPTVEDRPHDADILRVVDALGSGALPI